MIFDRYAVSGPEEGDTIDTTVLIIDEDGTELIRIALGTLPKRKGYARRIAKLMNESGAVILGDR